MQTRPNRRLSPVVRTLAAAAAIVSHAPLARSGPHAGGTLILHREASITYTQDDSDPCGLELLESCESALTSGRGNEIVILSIYAAFPVASSPRMTEVRFSVATEERSSIAEIGSCADEMLLDPEWPERGSDVELRWNEPARDRLVRVAWLAVSNQDDLWSARVSLLRHNLSDWTLADDAQPAAHDEAAGYGVFGFLRPGTTPCPDGGEPLGACCIPPEWQCERLTSSQCDALDFFTIFSGPGADCDDAPCSVNLNPCCLPGDICLYASREGCEEKGGFFHEDDLLSCLQVSCEVAPQGACCFENGVCSGATNERCSARGGVYQGDLVPCEPAPCPAAGRCCFASDGSCAVLIAEACAEQGGEFTPGETDCRPNPCAQPPSACRLSTDVDSCAVLTPEECKEIGIVFQGDGIPCSESYCGPWPAVEQHSWGRIKLGFR